MARYSARRNAFTLMELLVVVGIIALLIGILLPSMKAARLAAKKNTINAQIKALEEGLELFNNDNGEYPDSSKRPDPTDYAGGDDPLNRTITHAGLGTTLYGAQALARAMVGKDFKGYVNSKRARKFDASLAPTEWYDVPSDDYVSLFPRHDVYFNDLKSFWRTALPPDQFERQLGGVRPAGISEDNTQLVIVDVFERPVLYYRANPNGTVLCDATADGDGYPVYDPENIPYYNLLDNDIFTGSFDTFGTVSTTDEPGWRFASGIEPFHQIREFGDPAEPHEVPVTDPATRNTFAKYIHDHKAELASGGAVRPHNPDSYILISAGIDGYFGTEDDVNNISRGE